MELYRSTFPSAVSFLPFSLFPPSMFTGEDSHRSSLWPVPIREAYVFVRLSTSPVCTSGCDSLRLLVPVAIIPRLEYARSPYPGWAQKQAARGGIYRGMESLMTTHRHSRFDSVDRDVLFARRSRANYLVGGIPPISPNGGLSTKTISVWYPSIQSV